MKILRKLHAATTAAMAAAAAKIATIAAAAIIILASGAPGTIAAAWEIDDYTRADENVMRIDEELLAAYIEGSDGEDLCTMIAVGATLCNRVRSGEYSDSLTENGASLGLLPSPNPSKMARYAAGLVAEGVDNTFGAVHIYNSGDIPDGADVTLVTKTLAFGR